MQQATKTHVLKTELPIVYNNVLTISGKTVLFFAVAKGASQIYQLSDGRCVRRQDRATVPVEFQTLLFSRSEQISREYDRQFVDGAQASDLDIRLVQSIANEYMPGISAEQYLQQMGIAEYSPNGMRFRKSALLLFAQDIRRWEPRCQVRILRINGENLEVGEKYNVVSDEEITGNIFTLLSQLWESLIPYLSNKTVLGADARFEQRFVYPENACREALINAIAHRDYSISNPIIVYFYTNRVTIENPGSLLSTIRLKDILEQKGVHESRNSYIAHVLRESKYMRELGEGMRRIFILMEELELAPPDIDASNSKFSISFHHKSIYSTQQLAFLKMYEKYSLDMDEKRVLICGMSGAGLSQSKIYDALRTTDRNVYDRCVTKLRAKGILLETRSNLEAKAMARARGMDKKNVIRFSVALPEEIERNQSILTSRRVFVDKIPSECSSETLRASMSIFGAIAQVFIPKNEITHLNKGFAFITFIDEESALKAIAIQSISIGGQVASIYKYKDKYGLSRS